MKYIIVESYGLPLAVVFDEILSHDTVATAFYPLSNILSAGKCDRSGNAYGKSVTLGLASRAEDTTIIQDSFNRTI